MNALAREIAKDLLCEDPQTEFRIENGIEAHRKGFGCIELFDPDGKPVERADIAFRQLRHEYRFGCNAFMLGQFNEAAKNALYEERFASLFNLAVAPFYWRDLEPEDGKTRFAKESPPIYRRPPPDAVLEFCEQHHILPKGHLLLWHTALPKWLTADKQERAMRLERRIREIADRYAGRINLWDVANEALQWNPIDGAVLPESHVETAFRMAGKYFPESTELLYNEGTLESWGWFHGDYTPLYLLSRHLLGLGLPIRGMGLQYHMFRNPTASLGGWGGQYLDQRFIFAHLDLYAKLGIPINISEITITGHRDLGDGDTFQERVVEKLYRIWFSHPATNGIVWWNLVDGTAAFAPMGSEAGENQYRGGLLNFDLSPKPAFKVLDRLINQTWTSSGSLAYAQGKANSFHGFFGDYALTIKTANGIFEKYLKLSKDSKNRFAIACLGQDDPSSIGNQGLYR